VPMLWDGGGAGTRLDRVGCPNLCDVGSSGSGIGPLPPDGSDALGAAHADTTCAFARAASAHPAGDPAAYLAANFQPATHANSLSLDRPVAGSALPPPMTAAVMAWGDEVAFTTTQVQPLYHATPTLAPSVNPTFDAVLGSANKPGQDQKLARCDPQTLAAAAAAIAASGLAHGATDLAQLLNNWQASGMAAACVQAATRPGTAALPASAALPGNCALPVFAALPLPQRDTHGLVMAVAQAHAQAQAQALAELHRRQLQELARAMVGSAFAGLLPAGHASSEGSPAEGSPAMGSPAEGSLLGRTFTAQQVLALFLQLPSQQLPSQQVSERQPLSMAWSLPQRPPQQVLRWAPLLPATPVARAQIAFRQPGAHGTKVSDGTPRYAGLWQHWGLPAGPKDDAEALCFVLIYLATGRLPWQGLPLSSTVSRDAWIGEWKAAYTETEEGLDQLCSRGRFEPMAHLTQHLQRVQAASTRAPRESVHPHCQTPAERAAALPAYAADGELLQLHWETLRTQPWALAQWPSPAEVAVGALPEALRLRCSVAGAAGGAGGSGVGGIGGGTPVGRRAPSSSVVPSAAVPAPSPASTHLPVAAPSSAPSPSPAPEPLPPCFKEWLRHVRCLVQHQPPDYDQLEAALCRDLDALGPGLGFLP